MMKYVSGQEICQNWKRSGGETIISRFFLSFSLILIDFVSALR